MAPVGAGCRQTVWTQSFSRHRSAGSVGGGGRRLVATCDVVFMGTLGDKLTEPWHSEKVLPKVVRWIVNRPRRGLFAGEIAFARERG